MTHRDIWTLAGSEKLHGMNKYIYAFRASIEARNGVARIGTNTIYSFIL